MSLRDRGGRRAIDRVSGALAVLGSVAAGGIAIAIAIDVVTRGVAGGSIPGLVEFIESLLVATVFLGMADAERTSTHVRVTLVTERIRSQGTRRLVRAAGMTAGLVMAVLFAWYTGVRAYNSTLSLETRFGLLEFPLWPARIIIAVGFVALAVAMVARIFDVLAGREDITPETEPPEARVSAQKLI